MRYFKHSEFDSPDQPGSGAKMSQELLDMLDELRHRLGFPLTVNSGYRTESHNWKVGGKPSSSHLKGLAVDLSAKGGSVKYAILKEALAMGFTRIGIGQNFIHLDIDESLPQEVVWTY